MDGNKRGDTNEMDMYHSRNSIIYLDILEWLAN